MPGMMLPGEDHPMNKIVVAVFALGLLLLTPGMTQAGQRFPADPDTYRDSVQARIDATWHKIEHKLDQHKVSKARKDHIRELFDQAVVPINDALDKASEDGKITRGEAYKIGVMTSGLRGKVRARLAIERAEKRAERGRKKNADRDPADAPSADEDQAVVDDSADAPPPAPARPAQHKSKGPRKRGS